MKLELKHIIPYLPHCLKCKVIHKTIEMIDVKNDIFILDTINLNSKWKFWTHDNNFCGQFNLNGKGFRSCDFKPILKQMSYLHNEIDIISSVPNFFNIDYIINTPLSSSYEVVVKLLELHYDVFGLIDSGLAIDANKLLNKKS